MKYNEIISNNDIKYIMYVDASGDDGFDFREMRGDGSSPCYTVAAFATAIEDIPHNIEVLNNAKKLLGHQDNKSELKYTKVRRHRKSEEIHNEILDNLKGTLFIFNAFKKRDLDMSDKPFLSSLCHYLPIKVLSDSYHDEAENFCIVVDHMKTFEEKGVSFMLESDTDGYNLEKQICYMDSKDADARLIQIADFFSGLYRNFFESIYNNPDEFRKCLYSCPPCIDRFNRNRGSKYKCLFSKSGIHLTPQISIYISKSLRIVLKDSKYSFAVSCGIGAYPIRLGKAIEFIDCKLNSSYRK